MKVRLTIPLVLWALAASSVAAATIQFEASVERTRASQSEPIRLTLRITSDEQLSEVTPEFDLKDFDVEGPATSTRMEMRNTNITFTRELTYALYAKQAGTFTIGPFQLEMDGERYHTKPITVEIVRGTSRAQAGQAESPIFVLARADPRTGLTWGSRSPCPTTCYTASNRTTSASTSCRLLSGSGPKTSLLPNS